MTARAGALQSHDPRTTRDMILDSAEQHFAARGFDGVSVREIAADAGLKNQASLYHHFTNKRALYEAVLERGIGPVVELVVASAGPSPTAVDGPLADFLDAVLDHLAQHPHLPRLIQRAALDDGTYLRDTVGRALRPLYDEGLAVLALAEGPWESEDYFHLGAGLYQLIFGYFANAQLFGAVAQADPLAPEVIARQRRFLRTAVALLMGGSTPSQTARSLRAPQEGVRP